MRDFHNLLVWQKSHRLALEIYRLTRDFPPREMFGLTGQIRRACVSIPSNIAEGCGRESDGEFRHFLEIAAGSASEVEYQLLFARDFGYLDETAYAQLTLQVVEVRKMLAALIARFK